MRGLLILFVVLSTLSLAQGAILASLGDSVYGLEGAAGTNSVLLFTIHLSAEVTTTSSVSFSVNPGTASPGVDYRVPLTNTVTFLPGSTQETVTVQVIGDDLLEATETVELVLGTGTGVQTSFPFTATGYIVNDDGVALTATFAPAQKESWEFTYFDVTLASASTVPVTFKYHAFSKSGNTATPGVDFDNTVGTVTIPAGETTANVEIVVFDDTFPEGDETFTIRLYEPENAVLRSGGANSIFIDGTITILDDEVLLSLSDVTAPEGTGANTNFVFAVTLSRALATGESATVGFELVHGTTDDADFVLTPIPDLNFATGETTKNVTIVVAGDALVEDTETFEIQANVKASTPAGLVQTGFGAKGTGTIVADDSGITLSLTQTNNIGLTRVPETTGDMTFVVTVAGTNAGGPAGSYDLTVRSNTAVESLDFQSSLSTITLLGASQTISWNAGSTPAAFTFTVSILDDAFLESDETFSIDITNTNAQKDVAAMNFTIEDSTVALTVSNATSQTEGHTGTRNMLFTFTISRTQPTDYVFDIEYTTPATGETGIATPGTDFTGPASVTLLQGNTTVVLTVQITGDVIGEPDEWVQLAVVSSQPALILAQPFGTGLILDDDFPIYVRSTEVIEGTGTINTNVVVTLFANDPFPASSTISYLTQQGTAGPSDFINTPAPVSVTLPVGLTETTITVQVVADSELEPTEYFNVTLVGGTGGAAPGVPPSGVITIINDDGPTLSVANVAALESSGQAVFTFTLASPPLIPASVLVSTGNLGSALPDVDYTSVTDQLVNFPVGNTTATFTVTLLDDALIEATETFTLRFNTPNNLRVPTTILPYGRIVNDDGPQYGFLNLADFSLPEGTAINNNTPFTFVIGAVNSVTTTNPAAQIIFETIGGTATADADYVPVQNLSVTVGDTPVTVTVFVFPDDLKEPSEQFQVRLFYPDFVSLSSPVTIDLTETVTILGDDFFANITGYEAYEGDFGDPSPVFVFNVTFDGPASEGSTLTFQTLDGTALTSVTPLDYVPIPSTTVTIPTGAPAYSISVTVVPDSNAEPDEQFTVELTSSYLLNLGTPKTAIGNILNDDFTLDVVEQFTFEGDVPSRDVIFTYSIDGPAFPGARFTVTTADGTAIAGEDYVAFSTDFLLTPGVREVNITVTILGDLTPEPSKTFALLFTNEDNIILGASSSTITIIGDDGEEISVVGASVLEGNTTAQTLNFVVTASGPVLAGASFSIQTSNIGTEDGDFAAVSAPIVVVFPEGETTVTVSIDTVPDTLAEDTEDFLLIISEPAFLTFPSTVTSRAITAVGTIINDDGLGITIPNVVLAEGSSATPGATKDFVFSATLVGGVAPFGASVSFTTQPGTATLGSDYLTESGTITWVQGQNSAQVTIQVLADQVEEAQETLTLHLHTPNNLNIQGFTNTTITISNDDSVLTISNGQVLEGKEGTVSLLFFNVTLATLGSPAPPTNVQFRYATRPDTAVSPSDYTATSGTFVFTEGQTTGAITVTVIGDELVEFDEMFFLDISNVQNALYTGPSSLNGTILSDDVQVNVVDDGFYEGDTTYIYRLALLQTATSPNGATVTYQIVPGTAVEGVDYRLLSPTNLTLSANETRIYVDIEIIGNSVAEAGGDKTFQVVLLNCLGCAVGTSSVATITLFADDYSVFFEQASVTVEETESTFDLTVTLLTSQSLVSSGPAFEVTVETVEGTALDGEDYTARTTSYVFAPGASSATFTVPILGDTISEATENFVLRLVNPVGLKLGTPNTQQVTILDNDARLVRVSYPRVIEGGDSRRFISGVNLWNLTFAVRLSGPAPANSSVTYTTEDGTATADEDYIPVSGTYAFTEGDLFFNVDVQVIADFQQEDSETLWLRITSFTGDLETDADTDGRGTIINDDYQAYGLNGVVRSELRVNNPIA